MTIKHIYKALVIMRAFLIFTILSFLVVSCGSKEKNSFNYNPRKISKKDYIDHFERLSLTYLNSPQVEERKLSLRNVKYLESIYKRMVINNELVLKEKINPKFHIIKSNRPFYFSLPSGRFFMSDSLFTRYIKSENLLVALLSTEIYRVHKGLYEKKVVIPVGFSSTKKMLSLHKLSLEVRVESLKWSYFILKRSGYDPFSVLSWIQVQNKNSLDFSIQSRSNQSQTREEYLFKGFLAQEVKERQNENLEKNSSKGFYNLQRSL